MSQVYFVQSDEGGLIKIGKSADVDLRLDELQVGHPSRLKLLASIPENKASEAYYHERFAKDRVRGEWFAPSPDLLAEIARLPQKARRHAAPSKQDVHLRRENFVIAIKDIPDQDLAEAAGCSVQGVRHWRNLTRFPSGETLLNLIAAFPQVASYVAAMTGRIRTREHSDGC